jgi:hypothetical protein
MRVGCVCVHRVSVCISLWTYTSVFWKKSCELVSGEPITILEGPFEVSTLIYGLALIPPHQFCIVLSWIMFFLNSEGHHIHILRTWYIYQMIWIALFGGWFLEVFLVKSNVRWHHECTYTTFLQIFMKIKIISINISSVKRQNHECANSRDWRFLQFVALSVSSFPSLWFCTFVVLSFYRRYIIFNIHYLKLLRQEDISYVCVHETMNYSKRK